MTLTSILVLLCLQLLFPAGQVARNLEFPRLTWLDVGKNPHQISFSVDGTTAYVAAAASDRITLIDVPKLSVKGHLNVEGTPLGVVDLGNGTLLVSRFSLGSVAIVDRNDGKILETFDTGGSPSLLIGPLDTGIYLVSSEATNRVWQLDPKALSRAESLETGARPFPPAVTSDGQLVFVPNYLGGTVSVVERNSGSTLATVPVGEKPSGGALIFNGREYAAAVRGENKIAVIDVASRRVVRTLTGGIGTGPFSVLAHPSGRSAFVNNTASHEISVIDLQLGSVVARFAVPEIPIVMAVGPDGTTLWVSSEGQHALTVYEIPEELRR